MQGSACSTQDNNSTVTISPDTNARRFLVLVAALMPLRNTAHSKARARLVGLTPVRWATAPCPLSRVQDEGPKGRANSGKMRPLPSGEGAGRRVQGAPLVPRRGKHAKRSSPGEDSHMDSADKQRLLREGRMAIRRDLLKRFDARTPAWRETHRYPSPPGPHASSGTPAKDAG